MKEISGIPIGLLDTRYLKLDGSNSPMTGDLVMNDDTSVTFGHNAATQRKLYLNTNSDTLFLTNKQGEVWTDVGTEGGLYIYTNVQTDGAGSYEPTLHLANSGAVNLTNSTQGTAVNRVFTLGMNKFLFNPDTNRTDAFQIQANDTSVVFNVDNTNQRVGIGTDSPVQKLHAYDASSLQAIFESGRATNETSVVRINLFATGSQADLNNKNFAFENINQVLGSGENRFQIGARKDDGGNKSGGDHFVIMQDSGFIGMGNVIAPEGRLHLEGASTDILQILRANATQTANLTEWQNSSGTVLTNISATAGLDLTGANAIRITSSLDSDPLIKLNDLTIVENTLTYNSGFQATSTGQSTTFTLIRTSSSHALMQGGIDGDTFRRIVIAADGSIDIGSGSSSRDTNLYRFGANMLMTDDAFNAGRYLSVGSTDELARFHVVGRLDEIQQIIQLNSTQTNDAFQIQNSSTTVLSGADERGILFSHGGTNVTNVFMGDNAGNINMTGAGNFALGSDSLNSNLSGINNVAIGSQTLGNASSGDSNIGIGTQAGFIRTGGSNNILIGTTAGRSGSSNSNIAIGVSALYSANNGSNIAIGTNAGKAVTGTGNTLIGSNVGKTLLTAIDNQLHIHNADTTTPLIYGEFDTPLLKIHGRFQTNEDRVKSTETSTTTATMSDDVEIHICNGTTDYTLTLPTAVTGKVITITNKNTATITLSGTISSISATSVLYEGESIVLVYDGTEWV